MARISEASKQAVLDRIDAVALVQDYLRLEKKSGRYWGLCPFHHEKTPSFTVDPDRKLYYCFGCHKGGAIVDFVMEMDKLNFGEAMERLAKRFGVELVYEGGTYERDDGKARRLEALAELYRRVALSFHYLLMEKPEGEAAKRYILGRGISIETINRFRLGYSPSDRLWLFRFLSGKGGFSEEFLASSGLFSAKYPSSAFFSNRLMFPIADREGKTIAFGGRALSPDDNRKYLNSPESDLFKKGRNLFALDLALREIRASKTAVIAEGYMDALALHQAGAQNAVAPLGTAFTEDQARLLKRWADKVILMLDADEAGQNAAVKAIITCRKTGLDAYVALPPREGGEISKDPAEILQKNGAEALQNAVKCSILDFEYLLSRSKSLAEETGDTSKAAAFLFPYFAALDSEVLRDSYIGILAGECSVDRGAVRDDYNRFLRGGGEFSAPERKAVPDRAPRDDPPRMNSELYLLTAVFLHPGCYKELRLKLSMDDLKDRYAKELFIVLEEWYRNSGAVGGSPINVAENCQELFSALKEGGLKDFVMRQSVEGAFANPERIVADGIARVRSGTLQRRRAEIVRELRRPGINSVRQADLLAEKLHIDSELT